MKRRTLISAAPAFALATSLRARAEGERKFVGMSLVSDRLTYAFAAPGVTGRLTNRNTNKVVPLADAPYDRTALEVLAAEVPHHVPGAQMTFLSGRGPDAYAGQDDWFDGDKVTLPASIRVPIEQQAPGAALLLITKIKRQARVSDGRDAVGLGVFEGLGVYRDPLHAVHRDEDGLDYVLIAPYVYIRLSLVDVASSKVLRHKDIEVARPVYAETPADLVGAIQQQLVEGLTQAIGVVLKDA